MACVCSVLCVSRSERHVVRVFMCEEGLAHGRARQGALKRFLPRTMIVYHRTRKHPHCNHARAKSIEKSKLRKPAQLLTVIYHVRQYHDHRQQNRLSP